MSDYYLPCGCWSGQADHTCRVGNGWRPADCRCGAPDDCYCHEMCDAVDHPDNTCERHLAEHAESVNEDHAEAITEDRSRRWQSEDDAVRRLVAGHRPRVVTVAAYRENGESWPLSNGHTSMAIRPRDVVDGNTRLAAVRLARMVLTAVPEIASVQIWDTASGTNVWGLGTNVDGRTWFVAYPNRDRDGDPWTITDVADMRDVDGTGGRR